MTRSYAEPTMDMARALAAIGTPTMVLHRRGDLVLAIEASRHLAGQFAAIRTSLLDDIERVTATAGWRPARERVLATVLFTDIVGSTRRAFELGDRRWRELLEAHDRSVRRRVAAHGGRVLKSLGDGYLATFESPACAIHGGRALGEDAEALGLRVKVGVHTGECELMGDDVAGMAVHIGARVMTKARPGEVLATSAVRDLVVGSGIEFADRGSHELKGVPGVWTLLAAERRRAARDIAPAAGALARLVRRAAASVSGHRSPSR